MLHLNKIISLAVLILLLRCTNKSPQEVFDTSTQQQVVETHQMIDSIYNKFEKIPYPNLPKEYKEYINPKKQFLSIYTQTDFICLNGNEIYTKVVGNERLLQFMPTDYFYLENEKNPSAKNTLYTLLNVELLHKILDFKKTLTQQNLNPEGFYVRESFRHPFYNAVRGGASQSQHLFGAAADLVIEDINYDGIEDELDKQVALQILEEIIGDAGGLGRYPGTSTIHIDVRGFRARW